MAEYGWTGYSISAGICMLGVLISVGGEKRSSLTISGIGKVLAASAYIAAAMSLGATHSEYGYWLLAGMVLCWLGDVFLISVYSQRLFLVGLFSFLLGHIVYIGAFVIRGISQQTLLTSVVVMGLFAWGVSRWLLPHVSGKMKGPVWIYILAISLMMAMAIATFVRVGGVSLLLGAFLFVISDLFVARNKFINPGFINRALGLPLYFLAQLLLAASVMTVEA
jgi:uncharacterized membrane protein YhhN